MPFLVFETEFGITRLKCWKEKLIFESSHHRLYRFFGTKLNDTMTGLIFRTQNSGDDSVWKTTESPPFTNNISR